MCKANWLVGLAMAGLSLAGSGCATCKTPVAVVPAAAQRSIEQYAEGGTITEMAMLKDREQVFYEARVRGDDGSKIWIVVSSDGKLYKLNRNDGPKE